MFRQAPVIGSMSLALIAWSPVQTALGAQAMGPFRFESTPKGAALSIDGLGRGWTPLETKLIPGQHHLRLTRPGYEGESITVTTSTGSRSVFRIQLRPSVDHPAWVSRGSRVVTDGSPKLVGMGTAAGIKNQKLRAAAADNAARAEVQRLYVRFTTELMKAYAQRRPPVSTPSPSGTEAHDTGSVGASTKLFNSRVLLSTTIVAHWQHPTTNVLHSQARLDLDMFVEEANRVDLPPEVKRAISDAFQTTVERWQSTEDR